MSRIAWGSEFAFLGSTFFFSAEVSIRCSTRKQFRLRRQRGWENDDEGEGEEDLPWFWPWLAGVQPAVRADHAAAGD